MEIYVSTDIEADGPIPGENSMLSFGSAAFDITGKLLGTFSANLKTLPDAKANAETMKWWAQNPEAYKATRENIIDPCGAMAAYYNWLTTDLKGKVVFVGYPATFDFMFIYWYLIKFIGRSPFGFSALDIKTLAMAKMGTEWSRTVKKNMPKRWFDSKTKHNHVALDDAIEQGKLFINILNDKG